MPTPKTLPIYIPAIRNCIQLLGLDRNFSPLEIKPKLMLDAPKTKKIVVIPFRHVPYLRNVRFKKEWWLKNSFKTIMSPKENLEINPEQFVGVRLSDLTETEKLFIVEP